MNTAAPPPMPKTPNPTGVVKAVSPTSGSILGTLIASAVIAKLGITDPVYSAAIIAAISGAFTAAAHYITAKLLPS